MMRTEQQLRETVSLLTHFIWNGRLNPGEHLWAIPVDKERDFDVILTDAIDELVLLRAENAALLAAIRRFVWADEQTYYWEDDGTADDQLVDEICVEHESAYAALVALAGVTP